VSFEKGEKIAEAEGEARFPISVFGLWRGAGWKDHRNEKHLRALLVRVIAILWSFVRAISKVKVGYENIILSQKCPVEGLLRLG
jgi:hypothetical protein